MSNGSIESFLDGDAFAVVGASRDRSKYGNKVLRCYLQNHLTAFPVNPTTEEIEGLASFPDLASLPQSVHGVSLIVPPAVSANVVRQAGELGIQHVWFQPGAESDEALQLANELGMNVIANGPCLLVALGFRD